MITNRLPELPSAQVVAKASAASPDARTESPTDGELLMRFTRHGDREAFAQVVERHRKMVWGVCSRVLVRHADAEDAYQATLLILAKKAGSIRANDSAGGWLFRVAHNAALQSRRRRKALRETSLEEPPPAPEPLFPDLEQKQLVAALLEELRSLPQQYQTPLVLRYLEGKSRRQIAETMESTLPTIDGRLVRARRLLRSRLARRGVSFTAALGAFGVASTGKVASAGAIHGGPPAFDPVSISSALSSSASTAVQQLAHQGIRSMLFASLTKPAALGLAASLVAAVLLVDPQEGAAQSASGAPLVLQASIAEAGVDQAEADPVRLAERPRAGVQLETRIHADAITIENKKKSTNISMRSDNSIITHTEKGKNYIRLTGKNGDRGNGVLRVTVNGGEEKTYELALGKKVELDELIGVEIGSLALGLGKAFNLLTEFGEPLESPGGGLIREAGVAPKPLAAPAAVAKDLIKTPSPKFSPETGNRLLLTPPPVPVVARVSAVAPVPATAPVPSAVRGMEGMVPKEPARAGQPARASSGYSGAGFGSPSLNRPESPATVAMPPAPALTSPGPAMNRTRSLRGFLPRSGERVAQRQRAFHPPADADAALKERLDEIQALRDEIETLKALSDARRLELTATRESAGRASQEPSQGEKPKSAPTAAKSARVATAPQALAAPQPATAKFAWAGVRPTQPLNMSQAFKKPADHRLKPGDVLMFDNNDLSPTLGKPRTCVVEPSGTIGLGPDFGRVKVAGMTLPEAEAAVQKHVEKEYADTKIQLTPVVSTNPFVPRRAAGMGSGDWATVFRSPKSGPLQAGERVYVEVYDRVGDHTLLDERLTIDGDGDLALGARWGRLKAEELTLKEVEVALSRQVQDVAAKTAQHRIDSGVMEGAKPTNLGVQVTRVEPEVEVDPFAEDRVR